MNKQPFWSVDMEYLLKGENLPTASRGNWTHDLLAWGFNADSGPPTLTATVLYLT